MLGLPFKAILRSFRCRCDIISPTFGDFLVEVIVIIAVVQNIKYGRNSCIAKLVITFMIRAIHRSNELSVGVVRNF